MIERIIIAGSGGQGVLLLGKVLSEAAARENKHVTWLPAYGAEVRGGAAYCMVVISNEEIGSPYIKEADTLIVMNEASLEKFKTRLKKKGLLIINSSMVSDGINIDTGLEAIKRPFTGIALKLGNIKVANMVALGCFLARKKIINQNNVLNAIADMAPVDKKYLVEINKQAVAMGVDLVKQKGR